MKAPHIHFAVFQSRMGKRIFWMFVFCSFLPIIILSTLSFIQVNRQLRDQATARLRQMAKTIGMSLYERLELMDNELRLVTFTLEENPEGASAEPEEEFGNPIASRFIGLVFLAPDGKTVPLQGKIKDLAALTIPPQANLDADLSVVRVLPQKDRPARVFISIPTAIDPYDAGVLIGEIDATYLWGIGQQNNLPPLTELTIINQAGDLLVSSLPNSAELIYRTALAQHNALSHFTWRDDHQVYLSCYWDLFLKSRFQADTWTIVLSQSRENALSALQTFKLNFPLSLLVGFWIILLVSIRFIRKSLTPLEKLQEGTRYIQAGDFSRTVTLQSGDEFEDLATSFNLMTRRLARTFGELSVMAEVSQLAISRPEVVDLVASELGIMADRLNFDWGLLMIQGDLLSGEDIMAGFGLAEQSNDKEREVVTWGGNPQWQSLLAHAVSHPNAFFANDIQELSTHLPPSCMDFFKQIKCQSLLWAPMTFEKQPIGVLAVGKTRSAQPLTDSDRDLVTSIAAQTAVAINSTVAFHKLEESEARFRQAFDHAATGIVLVDSDQRIKASNRYLQHLLGYTEEELVDRPLEDILSSNTHADLGKSLAGMMAGEITFIQLEKDFVHQNGQPVPTCINGSLLRDKSGQPLHFILHIRDLKAERAAEQNRRRLEGQLRHAQKMEAIGTLAGGIAHDFNNILSAVSGYTELALMQLPADSKIHGQLTNVKKAAQRATDLVRQILTFSRQAEQEKMPVQISSIVKEALKLLRASLPATIEIRQSFDDVSKYILADPTQIHQIVMNLCTNALHAMEETGGILEVRLEQARHIGANAMPIAPSQKGGYLTLTISDNGCGMDPATLERIFEPYFTTKKNNKGTGLGLSLVHGIVENHGGTIRVASTPGQGTTFAIHFPIFDKQTAEMAVLPESPTRGAERLLFIDDEPVIVELGMAMLTDLGYQVVGMEDPLEALQRVQEDPGQFDLVITDLTMPKMTGDRLAENLVALRPDLPILLCSGYAKQIGTHPFLAGYIQKPITQHDLARAVRDALDR
jgi:PAS domain S-box-containing protein